LRRCLGPCRRKRCLVPLGRQRPQLQLHPLRLAPAARPGSRRNGSCGV